MNDEEDLAYSTKNMMSPDVAKSYLLHILKAGTAEERQQILAVIQTKFILHNKALRIA